VVAWLLRRLRHLATAHGVAVEAYCAMPDHLHLLARGTHTACDMIAFVSEFKRVTAEAWLRRFGGRLWQRHYYDHIIRSGENPDAVCWYIWLNPVRKNLCADPMACPHIGSFTGRWPPRNNQFLNWFPPWKKA
jgi:REP element-mobilizing transposase RayT